MEAGQDNSPFLATTVHLQEGLEVSTSDRDAAQAVAAGLRDAKAPNTRRAYASAWHMFSEWTILTGRTAIPADPQTVALYLGHLAADGKTIATISQARAAISHAHAAEGISQTENPARHPVVAETMKGWRNQAPAPQQAEALTAEALARIRETARLPRRGRGGSMESAAGAQARGAIDLAIIGVMSDGGLRRSEAADLTWNDIEFWGDGTARITIQKGKNSPEPATVAVTETTARALSSRGTGPGRHRPGNHRSDERRRTEALRSRRPHLERHRVLGRRNSPHHDPEGQELARASNSGGHRDHRRGTFSPPAATLPNQCSA